MSDLISKEDAIKAVENLGRARWSEYDYAFNDGISKAVTTIKALPSAEPTLRERALMLLLNWAEECGFGYDNFPEEYERYKDEIEDMSYFDGMIYIAEKEVE